MIGTDFTTPPVFVYHVETPHSSWYSSIPSGSFNIECLLWESVTKLVRVESHTSVLLNRVGGRHRDET